MLGNNDVHLWTWHYTQFDPATLLAYRSLLTEDERQQIGRFRFENDQIRYLVTRAMLRTTLSRYADLPPSEWRFDYNPYGQPRISSRLPGADWLQFNLSHTKSLIVLAVARHTQLGVDVENFVSRPAPLDIASHFFAADEADQLARLPPEAQQRQFYEYWTLKESYIKARGMGLSIPLDQFWFSFPCQRSLDMQVHAELSDDPTRWLFWSMNPFPEYLLSLCVERISRIPPRLKMMRTAPGTAEPVAMDPVPVRTSRCLSAV
ncbi:4'-phosphopantetheinyl transferase family protein [Pseudomarimonas arenosa]|uniref:4'-phosphopantetheinyl transferase superfamily protein n=1 Tax=Pseudomarimonas arenosa TaxID=2774145 RepID=A0AAW3ZK40_9GAMM|nr:4'-phosphopantetheinyl transferase superfamily protein [Pseudomarimonas arenosa]MBD8525889.1 4'-phosphopantetheinyl transferase superfamily protein [Pseudomarimonas arenosa]